MTGNSDKEVQRRGTTVGRQAVRGAARAWQGLGILICVVAAKRENYPSPLSIWSPKFFALPPIIHNPHLPDIFVPSEIYHNPKNLKIFKQNGRLMFRARYFDLWRGNKREKIPPPLYQFGARIFSLCLQLFTIRTVQIYLFPPRFTIIQNLQNIQTTLEINVYVCLLVLH